MKLFPFHLIEVLTSTCFCNSLQGIQEHDVEVAFHSIRFMLDQCMFTHARAHTCACTKYISFNDDSSIVIPFLFIPYISPLVQCVGCEMSVIYIATTTFPAYFLSF